MTRTDTCCDLPIFFRLPALVRVSAASLRDIIVNLYIYILGGVRHRGKENAPPRALSVCPHIARERQVKRAVGMRYV